MNQYKLKYQLNTSYFNTIDTEDKSYFLGFIAADGCITADEQRNNYRLKIQICSIDEHILHSFCSYLGSNKPIERGHFSGYSNGKEQSKLAINSKPLVSALISHDIHPRKSLTLTYPDECIDSHFIRGYFDGDGCLYTCDSRPQIEILGTESFLTSINSRIPSPGRVSLKTDKLYRLRITKKQHAIDFLQYIYLDSTIKLDRKYQKAISFICQDAS